MKVSKYNKSEIMRNAHSFYKSNKSFGWSFSRSLSLAWNNAKQAIINTEVESKNKEINRLREMIGYLQGVLFKNGIDVNTHLSVKCFK